tara:strand:+ start:110 stop:361 length:252 start_codon:yes stop_codon:yes gene_type:complete
MPLTFILKNKLLLQKNFNLQEVSMDMWPYWMFEENIKLVNEIIEDENKDQERQQESQQDSTPNFDSNQMMRNMNSMTNNIPKM